MKKPDRYGDILFTDINIIRHSRFSHYLIEKESMLELNSMKAIYLGLKETDDMLDRHSWGLLYPIYQLYRELRFRYRKFKHHRKYPNIERLEKFTPPETNGKLVGLKLGSGIGLVVTAFITGYFTYKEVPPIGSAIYLLIGIILLWSVVRDFRKYGG